MPPRTDAHHRAPHDTPRRSTTRWACASARPRATTTQTASPLSTTRSRAAGRPSAPSRAPPPPYAAHSRPQPPMAPPTAAHGAATPRTCSEVVATACIARAAAHTRVHGGTHTGTRGPFAHMVHSRGEACGYTRASTLPRTHAHMLHAHTPLHASARIFAPRPAATRCDRPHREGRLLQAVALSAPRARHPADALAASRAFAYHSARRRAAHRPGDASAAAAAVR